MSEQPEAPEGWKRNESGVLERAPAYNPAFPKEAVWVNLRGGKGFGCNDRVNRGTFRSQLCGKPAKHDPDHNGNPTKCGVHCKAAQDKRDARVKARWDEERAARQAAAKRRETRQALDAELRSIAQQIADGHNDPRTLCADWLRRDRDMRG